MYWKKERKADSVLLLHAFSFLVSNGFESQQVQYWGICVWDSPFFSKNNPRTFSHRQNHHSPWRMIQITLPRMQQHLRHIHLSTHHMHKPR